MSLPSGTHDMGNAIFADLARINVRYLLEWRRNGNLFKSISLPLPPKSLQIQQSIPTEITYTLGKDPIREFGRVRHRTIELNGSSGLDARAGYSRKGTIINRKGTVLLDEFRHFIEEYQRYATTEGELHSLIFRALDEGFHVNCELKDLLINRDAEENHFAFGWTLTLQAYDDAEEERPFNDLQNKIDEVTASINTINDALAVANVATSGANEFARLFFAPLAAINDIMSSIDDLADSITDITRIPQDLLGSLANSAFSFRQTAVGLIGDFDRFGSSLNSQWQQVKRILGIADSIQFEAEGILAFTPQPKIEQAQFAALPSATPQSFNKPSSQATAYRLRLGEDLQVIAQRFFGDAARFTEIQALNGWLDAHRLPSGRLSKAGDLILIPAQTEGLTVSSEKYATDLFIRDGDLHISNDDLVTVSGYKNLEQGISLRLAAKRNETYILQQYGLPDLVGRKLTTESSGLLAAHCREQLLRDGRIEDVPIIEFTDLGDHIKLDIEVQPIISGLLQFDVRI